MLRLVFGTFALVVFCFNQTFAAEPGRDRDEPRIQFMDLDLELLGSLVDSGPVYDLKYVNQDPAEIIWQARAEVILMGTSEVVFLRNAIRRARDRAAAAGLSKLELDELSTLEAELTNALENVPRIRNIAGPEIEVLNMQFFEKKAKIVFAYSQKIAAKAEITVNAIEQAKLFEQKKLLDSCCYLLQRAGMFYIRVGRSKAEACMLEQLYCKGYWTECDILMATRIRDTTCALHGEYLVAWFPAVTLATTKWSAEKAQSLAGKNDLDAQACDDWLQEMKDIILESYGKEDGQKFIDKVYPDPKLRTLVWLLCARTMRCSSLNYMGTAPVWSPNDETVAHTGRETYKAENLEALKYHLNKMAIECCEPPTKPQAEIVQAVPVPAPQVPESSPCNSCGGVGPKIHVMPSWCAPIGHVFQK